MIYTWYQYINTDLLSPAGLTVLEHDQGLHLSLYPTPFTVIIVEFNTFQHQVDRKLEGEATMAEYDKQMVRVTFKVLISAVDYILYVKTRRIYQ